MCSKRNINFKGNSYYWGLPCGEPGVGLDDACGSLPIQHVL